MARILILDDREWLHDVFSGELLMDGHVIYTTRECDTIWEQIVMRKPDLVIMDLFLKSANSWDILLHIKMIDPDLPVFIVSPSTDAYLQDARLSFADGYLVQNILATKQLREKIKMILKNPKKRAGNLQSKRTYSFINLQ